MIWKNFQKNNILKINPNTISFIETEFEGNYENYLYFIIPRITKLNEKQILQSMIDFERKSQFESYSQIYFDKVKLNTEIR